MALSVIEPLDRALTRTREILFQPFDITKWFKLGFCAFLAHLADGGGGGSGGSSNGWQSPARSSDPIGQAGRWFEENWEVIVGVGSVVLVFIMALVVLVLWLQARGRFMFLDGVVRNRGAVVEPWGTYRSEGNSTFWFTLCLSLVGMLLMLLSVALGVGLAWTDIDSGVFGPAAWTGLILGGGVFVALAITLVLIDMFLADFVVPAMYARRVGVMEGWSAVRREVFGPHLGTIALYVLIKILIALVSAALVFGLICVTFCTAICLLAIPYIGTVLMLPLYVFTRCYSLYFLEQLGDDWKLVSA
jgi:hypothetical protein